LFSSILVNVNVVPLLCSISSSEAASEYFFILFPFLDSIKIIADSPVFILLFLANLPALPISSELDKKLL